MPPRRPLTQQQAALKHAWRSGLEESVAAALDHTGDRYLYEVLTVPFRVEETRRYTPDFILPNGIVVESKGLFPTADRKKHRLVQAQHPALDLRFVFSNSRSRISKQSLTTYGLWAEKMGLTFADRLIPTAWLAEPANRESQDAVLRLVAGGNPEKLEAVLKLFRRRTMP